MQPQKTDFPVIFLPSSQKNRKRPHFGTYRTTVLLFSLLTVFFPGTEQYDTAHCQRNKSMVSWGHNALVLILGTALFGSSVAQEEYVHQNCIPDLNDLHDLEVAANTTVHRRYRLCKRREFSANSINVNFNLGSGQRPLTARPNLFVKCGSSGKLENECIIKGGDLHIDATDKFGSTEEAVNVEFKGMTFTGSNKYSFWGTKPGNITFTNCAFTVRSIVACFAFCGFRIVLLCENTDPKSINPLSHFCLHVFCRNTPKQRRPSCLIMPMMED